MNRFAKERERQQAAAQEEQRLAQEAQVTSGRGLPGGARKPKPTDSPSSAPLPAGHSPFGGHNARPLAGAPAESHTPVGVYAILASLLFTTLAGGGVLVVFAGVYYHAVLNDPLNLYTNRSIRQMAKLADDTDMGADPEQTWIPEEVRAKKRAHRAAVSAKRRSCEEATAAPWQASATIIMAPGGPPFLSIEVNCARHGNRERADFSSKRATVPNIWSDDKCVVTFQGATTAKAWISAGETRRCTFNPTNCKVIKSRPRGVIPECAG